MTFSSVEFSVTDERQEVRRNVRRFDAMRAPVPNPRLEQPGPTARGRGGRRCRGPAGRNQRPPQRAGNRTTPAHRTLYDAHLTRVTDLIDEQRYSRPLGIRLHGLAAGLSQTVGWIRFDHGEHSAASRYWIAGLHNAHAGDDRDMGAALLSDPAYQASWRDDPTAAGILTKDLARTSHPAASSLLHLRLAHAQAALGEHRATLHFLNSAERLLGTGDAGDIPAWCLWMSPADLAVDTGRCLLDLGDTTRAHSLIAEGQALLPASRDKTRGIFLAYQAQGISVVANPRPQWPPPSKHFIWPNESAYHVASSSSAIWLRPSPLTKRWKACPSCCSPSHERHMDAAAVPSSGFQPDGDQTA
ncbi:hypothetical protein ACWCXX_38680 [Streptomyces sp. NPDC001732]